MNRDGCVLLFIACCMFLATAVVFGVWLSIVMGIAGIKP